MPTNFKKNYVVTRIAYMSFINLIYVIVWFEWLCLVGIPDRAKSLNINEVLLRARGHNSVDVGSSQIINHFLSSDGPTEDIGNLVSRLRSAGSLREKRDSVI